MRKTAVKEVEQPWFGSFTPFDPSAPPPLLIPAEPEPLPPPMAVASVPQTGPGGGVSYPGFLYEQLQALETALGGIGTSGNVLLTKVPDATANYGVLSVGDGGFGGAVGDYAGGVGGSLIAVNLNTGGTADLINLQIEGVSKFKLGSGGNVTMGDAVNFVLNTTTGTKFGTAAGQEFGFFNATPVIQPATNTDIRTALVNLGLLAGGANPLNTNGALVSCSGLQSSSGVGGLGTAFPWKRLPLTLADATDYTLSSTERENVVIDVQSGTGDTNLIVPSTATGFYILVNRSAHAMTLKVTGQTGKTVAAGRTAMLSALGGTTMFRLTADVDHAA